MKTKVENLLSPRTYNQIANQFDITTDNGRYFQSYRSIIVHIDKNGNVTLDEKYYNYSRITIKYRNQYLNEDSKAVEAKIKSGFYKLANLN